MRRSTFSATALLFALLGRVQALRLPLSHSTPVQYDNGGALSRRSVLTTLTAISVAALPATPSYAVIPNGLPLSTAASGLKWADAKVGTGEPLKSGSPASIDYSMASTAGRFPQIYTTKDKGTPYRWTLGDGTTIAGIEQAILGGDGIPPMQPGGIRRVIIPNTLGYQALAAPKASCTAGSPRSVGPIPPRNDSSGAYQRWIQFYCNPRIPYQPDLVFDIKLYGKRTMN